MNLLTLLDDAIETLLNKLAGLDPTEKEYETVNKNLGELMDRKIEIEKHLAAEAQAEKQLKSAETQAEKKLAEERKARFWEFVIDTLKFLLQLGFSIAGVLLAFTFEEKGSITSGIGRKLYDRIIRK